MKSITDLLKHPTWFNKKTFYLLNQVGSIFDYVESIFDLMKNMTDLMKQPT